MFSTCRLTLPVYAKLVAVPYEELRSKVIQVHFLHISIFFYFLKLNNIVHLMCKNCHSNRMSKGTIFRYNILLKYLCILFKWSSDPSVLGSFDHSMFCLKNITVK